MKFYVGLHQPSDAKNFDRCCISINRVRNRFKPVGCDDIILDSGAFTELSTHGFYRHEPHVYAEQIATLYDHKVMSITAAVAQDYMCEPFITSKTGLDIATHQQLTIERYDKLMEALNTHYHGSIPFHVLPVIQGYNDNDYLKHVIAYGDRLTDNHWTGVGSVCKRQGNIKAIMGILGLIKWSRPGLRLHGFGVKTTALRNKQIRSLLYSADSMAWSYQARIEGRNQNDWREAKTFADRIVNMG